jgi:uncharacterized protein (TIGR02246 family)
MAHKTIVWFFLAIVALSMACKEPRHEASSPVPENEISEALALKEHLIALEKAALHRWRQGDPSGFLDLVADDYTYFDDLRDERVDGKQAITAIYEELRGKIHFPSFELIEPRVQVFGDLAVLTFNFRSFGPKDESGEEATSNWHTTEVFARQGPEWRLISTHWSPTGPALKKLAAEGMLPTGPLAVADTDTAPVQGEAELEVLAHERGALDRWGRGDPGGFLDIVSDDITFFDPALERRIDGRERLAEYLEPIRGKVSVDRDQIIEPRVQALGEAAVLTFNYESYDTQPDGTETSDTHWHATEVYAREGDRWRLVSTHWSYTASQLAHMSEFLAGSES